ncbi:2'-5' RNA ligase family protein [Pseudokineococcus lusitanus]|nr:2'-5' RNA ligase family protein [Pseudokineococcus lusitanus]
MSGGAPAPGGRPVEPAPATMGIDLRPLADHEVTVGVAVAVPEPHATRLREHRRAFGDPLADAVPPHVTLLPPTTVPSGRVDEVLEHLQRAAAATGPFTLSLRGTGTFRPVSPVVFVALAEGAAECGALERAVRRGPLERELAFDYHPHVTVAHHVPDAAMDRALAELSDFEVDLAVDAFWLYRHGHDGVWRPYRRFRLVGDAAAAGGAA